MCLYRYVFAIFTDEEVCRKAHKKLQGVSLNGTTLAVQCAKKRLTKEEIEANRKQKRKEQKKRAKERKQLAKKEEYEAKKMEASSDTSDSEEGMVYEDQILYSFMFTRFLFRGFH